MGALDRTTGVYGAHGCGKTLDLLAPALLAHPGAAMATLTKLDDLLLTLAGRQAPDNGRDGPGERRPVAVLDPFGMAPGVPELVWDTIAGLVHLQLNVKARRGAATLVASQI